MIAAIARDIDAGVDADVLDQWRVRVFGRGFLKWLIAACLKYGPTEARAALLHAGCSRMVLVAVWSRYAVIAKLQCQPGRIERRLGVRIATCQDNCARMAGTKRRSS